MRPSAALPLLAVAALAGCAESHGRRDAEVIRDAFVRSDRRLVELTTEEWRALCVWSVSLREPEDKVYECMDGERVSPCDARDCWRYEHTFERCFGPRTCTPRAFLGRDPPPACGPGRTADCAATVGEWTACQEAHLRFECWAGSVPLPECAPLFECVADPDAGLPPADAGSG